MMRESPSPAEKVTYLSSEESQSSSTLLLPEEFFAIRQYVPGKAPPKVLYPLALIVYVVAMLMFLYIFWLESNSSTTETQFSAIDYSDSTWTCSMASIVSKSVDYIANEELTTSYATSYDIVNINGLQTSCASLLSNLDPCSMKNASVTLNSTTGYSIGGWMASVTPYTDGSTYIGIIKDDSDFQVMSYNRNTGDFTQVLTTFTDSSLFGPRSACTINYLTSLALTYHPTQLLYAQMSGWIYWIPMTHSMSLIHIDGLDHSGPNNYFIAYITNDNHHSIYALSINSTVGASPFTYNVLRLVLKNETTATYSSLFSTKNIIYSFTVYHNETTNVTDVYYSACSGVYHWSKGVTTFIVDIPTDYGTSQDTVNNNNFVNIQYNPYLNQLYLTSLNYPAVVDLNSPNIVFQPIPALLTTSLSCGAYGGNVAVFPDNILMFTCDSISSYPGSAYKSIDQLIYMDIKNYNITIIEAAYLDSEVGWFMCDNTMLSTAPSSLASEQSVCSLNGLAWKMEYTGNVKYLPPIQAEEYFVSIAKDACNASQLYPAITTTLSILPPYSCTRNIPTSFISSITTAIADAQLFTTIILLILGIVLSQLPDKKPKTASSQPKQKGIHKIIDKILPSQFFYLPYNPILGEHVRTLYLLVLGIVSICVVIFVLLLVHQLHATTTESNISTIDIANSEWNCSMAYYLTGLANSTVNEPQTSYSFINVNEFYDDCLATFQEIDPCNNGDIYLPAAIATGYPDVFSYQSPYSSEILFTALEGTGDVYSVFSQLDLSTGTTTTYGCLFTAEILAATVAHGPNNTGYYPPQSTKEQAMIFNQNCQGVPIYNVSSTWFANSVTNDQYYNLYAVSGQSVYRLHPNYNNEGIVTSFNATVGLKVSKWVTGYLAVYLYKDEPTFYYLVQSSHNFNGITTIIAKYYRGKTYEMTTSAYEVQVNLAVNMDGSTLYVLDWNHVLHGLNTSSPTLHTMYSISLKASNPFWMSVMTNDSLLMSNGDRMWTYNIATNVTATFQYIASGTRMGWFMCGHELLSTLPGSIAEATVNCSSNGFTWQIEYGTSSFLPSAQMQSNAESVYETECDGTILYEQICQQMQQSSPYVCSRDIYATWSDVTSAAFANSHMLFTVLCVMAGLLLLVSQKMKISGNIKVKDLFATVFAANVFLPNSFFRSSRFRKGKASRMILLGIWITILLGTAGLFTFLVISQAGQTITEVSVELTDISNDEWSCSMTSNVTTEYYIKLNELSEYDNVNGRFFLINVNEGYDSCLQSLQQADPCNQPISSTSWQMTITSATPYSNFEVYSSVYSNKSNILYFNSGLNIPIMYNFNNGQLVPNINCPLASYIYDYVLIGSYVGVNEHDIAYFLGKYGIVTYDCQPVTVMNGSKPLFPTRQFYLPTTSNTGAYIPGIPHFITSDNNGHVITCINSTYTHVIECYQLTFINTTYATTSHDSLVFSINEPIVLFASCESRNNTSPYSRYLAYRISTIPGLYLVFNDRAGAASISYLVTAKTTTWLQFDDNCDYLYYAQSGTGIIKTYIPLFIHNAGASKTTVISTSLNIYFALMSSVDRLIYSIYDNSADYAYMFNLSTIYSTTNPGDIIYTGYSQSSTQWMICSNSTVNNIANTFSDAEQGIPYCNFNGLSLQFQFDNALYVYSQPMMLTYMTDMSELYCMNSSNLYDSLCNKVDSLPPYLCTREVSQSWLKILSIGIANCNFAYSLIVTIIGLVLPWMAYHMNKHQNTLNVNMDIDTAVIENKGKKEDERISEGDVELAKVIDATADEGQGELVVAVENPLMAEKT